MSKKILVISSSPRKGANSDTLCDEFIRGAKEAGHEVEKVALRDLKIHPCFACYYCASHTDECVQNDDIPQVMLKMEHADVVVLATPVYFYSVSAQMKMFIDRTMARWRNFKNKEFYYILTSGEDEPNTMDTTVACLRGLVDSLEGSIEKGIVYGKGLDKPWGVLSKPYAQQAYNYGKNA